MRIVNGNMLVGNALGLVPAPTADLVNATHSKDPSTGVIHYEADAQIERRHGTRPEHVLRRRTLFVAGSILGHLKSNIQTKKVLL